MLKEKYVVQKCEKHGITKFRWDRTNTRYRCCKCCSEAVQRRRDRIKLMAIEYKGGKCQICGYDKPIPDVYEFHHRDPTKKEFGIGHKGYTRSFDKVRIELDKCDILCANCHREIHSAS